jgi:hypothetical protein
MVSASLKVRYMSLSTLALLDSRYFHTFVKNIKALVPFVYFAKIGLFPLGNICFPFTLFCRLGIALFS